MKMPTLFRGNKPVAQRGFTLIELLIVIAIIGSVTALALPRFTLSNHSAETALHKVRGFVERGRMHASQSGNATRLTFTQKPSAYLTEITLADAALAESFGTTFDDEDNAPFAEKDLSFIGKTYKLVHAGTQPNRIDILLYPDGRMDPFILRLPKDDQTLVLTYNGTPLPGRISHE